MTTPPLPTADPPLTGCDRTAPEADGQDDIASVRTLRCRTVAQGRFQQLNYIRDLPPHLVAEVASVGLLDEDIAPNASEALLAALGSCLAVGIHAHAMAQRIPVRQLELELEADIHPIATRGAGDGRPKPLGFESVRVVVHMDADAPSEMLRALIAYVTLRSPVANTIHNPVHLDVALADAVAGAVHPINGPNS